MERQRFPEASKFGTCASNDSACLNRQLLRAEFKERD